MIQCKLKLQMCKGQEKTCEQWLYHLSSIYNFAVRKIELNAKNKIYFNKLKFQNLLANHSEKIKIPSHVIQGILCVVYNSWQNCFKKKGGKPKLKGKNNKLNSIPFPDPINAPKTNHVSIPGLGKVRFHKQTIPNGKIKCGQIVKKASGWYLNLFIDAEPKKILRVKYGVVGIDPGFKDLLTLSTGEKIKHPREFEIAQKRLTQAQRGYNKKLIAGLHERIANQRKDRNHKLSHRLVSENKEIYISKDNIKGIKKKFGKSVFSSAHYQLRQMLKYKSPKSGTKCVEVDGKFSTKTCSNCGNHSGPTGWAGLKVRQWCCSNCGVTHDRDINAARNTLLVGAGLVHESYVYA